MKKLLFIIILFSLQGYAQKKLEIYNFTPHTLVIVGITTSESGSYPEYSANLPSPGVINIASGDSYILENTGDPDRFPFDSPLSSPYISSWGMTNPPNPSVNMTSNAAWLLGDDQAFDRMAYRVINTSGSFQTGIIGETSPTASGPGWDAIYQPSTGPTTYTVVFF